MTPALAGIRAILFDLYGTLLDVHSVEAASGEVVADTAPFVALWRAKQLEYTFLRSMLGRYVDFWQITADALDYTAERMRAPLQAATRQRLLDAWLRLTPYPETPDALAALAASGRALGVLSNGSPSMLEAVLHHAGLRERFQHVLSVDAVRAYKPAAAVYELGCRAFGLRPAQILFVSSNGFDLAGAYHFGFAVCWINRNRVAADRLDQTPQLEVSGLDELAAALRGEP